MNLNQLGTQLPAQSIDWPGFGSPTTINLNTLTGDEVTPESSCFESVVKLVEGLYQLQLSINAERETENKAPLDIVDRKVEVSGNGNPMFVYTLNAELDSAMALNNLASVGE